MSRLVAEGHNVRRIIGRLDHGEELLRGLHSVCSSRNVRCGIIRASGVLEEVALVHYEAARKGMRSPVYFRGSLMLISAMGSLSELDGKRDLRLNVVVSRQGDNGIELIGGQCASAQVINCEFVVESVDDLLLRRTADRRNGLHLWTDAISIPTAAEPGAAPGADADAQQEAEAPPAAAPELPAEPEEYDEPYRSVRPGDIIVHQQFGRCEVQRVTVDEEFATVQLRNKRTVRLSLEVLDLRYDGQEDGQQVFEAKPARR